MRASMLGLAAALVHVLLITVAISGNVYALSLRDFLDDYVRPSGGDVALSREDSQPHLTTKEVSSMDPKNAQVLYSTPGLDGSYRATLTIDMVCQMDQFKMLCGMMGLKNAFGDVKQHVYLDFNEKKRELYIKADGHKPLFRFDW